MKLQSISPISRETTKQINSVNARVLLKQHEIEGLFPSVSIESIRKRNWEERGANWNDH